MSDVTIESIAIEIKASAEDADKALEKLTNTLAALKMVAQGGLEGTEKIAKELKQLAEAAKEFSGVDGEKIKNTAEALKALKSIGNIGDLSNAVAQMEAVRGVSNIVATIPDIDQGKIKSIRALGNMFKSLSQIGEIPDLSNLANQIQPLVTAANAIGQADMSTFVTNMRQLADGLKPLSGMQNHNFSSIVKGLERLPNAAKGISQMNLGRFARDMQQVASAIEPLSRQLRSLSSSFSGLPAPIQQAVTALMSYNTQAQNSEQTSQKLNKALNFANLTAFYFTTKKVVNTLSQFVNASNAYVENLNLFTVTMGDAADEALDFANTVNDVMGIDVSQWIQNQGIFKQMVSGFGLVEEKANLVSKNMTQLGYDIASYYNISTETAMLKLQSGLSGELEPLRRLGFALDVATLQQVAYNHGIETSIANMTQAQKAQLRYIAIMEQSKNAMGDMARTIDSPANQLRILKSRIETLKRAIGDSLMPVISAALPYVTAFVQILGESFRSLAEFMGFELPVFDYSDIMTKQNEDIASSFDDATEASQRFKGTLSSIDQLNIIGSKTESGGVGDAFNTDLNIDLPSYDFLGSLKAETSEVYKTLKEFLANITPIVSGIGIALGTLFVGEKLTSGLKALSEGIEFMSTSPLGKIASTITATVTAFLGFKKVVKDLTTGKNSFGALALGITGVATAATVLFATGNPIGAVLTVIGAGIGTIVGYNEGLKELDNILAEAITYADNGGIAISSLAKGYENYFSEISDGYDDIISTNNALKENVGKIRDAANEVLNITDKYRDMNEVMAGKDAETIKANIKEIGRLAKDYLGKQTSDLIDTLSQKFSTFTENLGYSVDTLSGKLRLLQGMGESKVDQLTNQANNLVDALSSGALHGEDFRKALNDLDDVTKKLSIPEVTTESVSFTKALQEMSNASVKFTPDTAISSIEELGVKADAAREKLQQAQAEQLANIQATKAYYKQLGVDIEFNANMKANGVDTTFDELWEGIEKSLDMGYASELKKIDIGQAAFLAQVQAQFDKNSQKYAESKFREKGPGFGSSWTNFFENGGLFASGEALYHQAISDYTNEYKNTNVGKELQSAINSSISGLNIENADEIGEYLMQGMASGVLKGQEDVNKALDAAARGAMDEFERICGIASPSKVFAGYGEYLMQGLANGISRSENTVLSSINDTVNAMKQRMSNISFNVPVYTSEDVDRGLATAMGGGYSMPPSPQYAHSGTDPEAVSQAGLLSINGVPLDVNVNVQSYVELDGDQVGEATTRYQQRQMAYSNGY